MDIANKDVFQTINDAMVDGLRKKFGPPEENPKLTAQIAVALLQLSFLYFAQTGAPKSVVYEFAYKLLFGESEKKGIKQDGNRLILPGQNPNLIKKILG